MSVDRKVRELRQGERLGGCFDNIAFKKGKHPEMGEKGQMQRMSKRGFYEVGAKVLAVFATVFNL